VKKLKILKVRFDTTLKPAELSQFRGAIIHKVGWENTALFHNHLDDSQFAYRYPLIQYKCIKHNPAIVCIDEGVDEIHKFFSQSDWSLKIGDRQVDTKIAELNLNQFTMQVWDKPFNYHIHNWVALNEERYHDYQQLTALSDKIHLLETIRIGNIISFAKGIDWTVDKPIIVKITDISQQRNVRFKKNLMTAFDLSFQCNVFLPNHIGLGRKVSVGFGNVRG
jgi:hypothetical protein